MLGAGLGAIALAIFAFVQLLQGMTNEQVAAIVDKFLRENPVRWTEGMNVLVFSAMSGACPA